MFCPQTDTAGELWGAEGLSDPPGHQERRHSDSGGAAEPVTQLRLLRPQRAACKSPVQVNAPPFYFLCREVYNREWILIWTSPAYWNRLPCNAYRNTCPAQSTLEIKAELVRMDTPLDKGCWLPEVERTYYTIEKVTSETGYRYLFKIELC